jgi:hypothetical protein
VHTSRRGSRRNRRRVFQFHQKGLACLIAAHAVQENDRLAAADAEEFFDGSAVEDGRSTRFDLFRNLVDLVDPPRLVGHFSTGSVGSTR